MAQAGYFSFVALSLLVLSPSGALGAQLSIASLALSPGGSGIVQVSYSSLGEQVSALQFDIQFDSAALSVAVIPGPALSSASKSLYGADLGAGWQRTLVAGLNQSSLTDGTLVTLFVSMLSGASAGAYAVGIANALGADPSGNPVTLTGASGVITIQPQNGSAIQAAGVLNAASWLPGAVAPGEVVTLMGSAIGPPQPVGMLILASGLVSTNLANTTVSFDSVPAPLLYADPDQINLVVPFEISGNITTLLTISANGQIVATLPVPIAAAAPGIFTQEGTGLGPAAAVNQDGSLNTPENPAAQGSILTLYLSGAGQTNPAGITGAIASAAGSALLSTTATIGGVAAEVLYSGPAPGLINGLTQVNLRLPAGVGASPTASVSVQVGNAASQGGVTVSVASGG